MTSLADIKGYVSEVRGVRVSDIEGRRRLQDYVRPRQEVMFLARHCTALSFPAIGAGLGHRDHTTVMHGLMAVQKRMNTEPNYSCEIENMMADIKNWNPRFIRRDALLFKSRRAKA